MIIYVLISLLISVYCAYECNAIACKNIIADLTKGEEFDGLNYDIWYYKIQYFLNKQDVLATMTNN